MSSITQEQKTFLKGFCIEALTNAARDVEKDPSLTKDVMATAYTLLELDSQGEKLTLDEIQAVSANLNSILANSKNSQAYAKAAETAIRLSDDVEGFKLDISAEEIQSKLIDLTRVALGGTDIGEASPNIASGIMPALYALKGLGLQTSLKEEFSNRIFDILEEAPEPSVELGMLAETVLNFNKN